MISNSASNWFSSIVDCTSKVNVAEDLEMEDLTDKNPEQLRDLFECYLSMLDEKSCAENPKLV